MTITTVRIQQWTAWSKDAANARNPSYGPASSTTYQVAVKPADSKAVPDHLRQNSVTYHQVNFHDGDVGLRVRDRVLIGDRILTVTGYYNAGERGRSFVAICEERPLA
jgi:hypothetical protein